MGLIDKSSGLVSVGMLVLFETRHQIIQAIVALFSSRSNLKFWTGTDPKYQLEPSLNLNGLILVVFIALYLGYFVS